MTVDPVVQGVVDELRSRLDDLPPAAVARRAFLGTYLRTTVAVGQAVAGGRFEDPAWVRRWDAVFAGFFLAAHDADLAGGSVPRPWRLAFAAGGRQPPLVHLLLELNAHLNWDLPQAMLAVLDADWEQPEVLATRRRDHERIDAVLGSRIAAEGRLLTPGVQGRLLVPLNGAYTRLFLPAARRLVWHNAEQLHEAARAGPDTYAARLRELDTLASAKIDDLLIGPWVLPRLTVVGFGVRLPPA